MTTEEYSGDNRFRRILIVFGQVFKGKEEEVLRKSIRKAHLGLTPKEYRKQIFFSTFAAFIGIIILLSFTTFFGYNITFFYIIPDIIAKIMVTGIFTAGTFLFMYYYPELIAKSRKTRIDLDLPYVITYMQALSTSTTLYDVIRKVYEDADLFGEIAKEFGLIVRNVELFGEDLPRAMRDLQNYTPSHNLSEFLNDLIMVSNTGGNISAFLASRSDFFRDVARRELEMALSTLEVLAEVYVTAFVAGPIVILIMMVAQNLTGKSDLSQWMPIILLVMPFGAAAIIWLLHLLLPPEDLDITYVETSENEYVDEFQIKTARNRVDSDFIKSIDNRRRLLKIARVLKNPLKYYLSSYYYGIIMGMVIVVVIVILYITGILQVLFTHFPVESSFSLAIAVFIIPILISYEVRRLYVKLIESQMPDFLRELSNMKDIGLTLQGAINLISKTKIGVLSSELLVASEEISRGLSTVKALHKMEGRIGVVSVKRAISLVVRASELTDYIREILHIAVNDFEHYLAMKYARFNKAFVYVMVVYLSFGVFLYTVYALNVSFISSFQNFNLPIDTSSNKLDMYRISITLGISSGLLAGKLSSNSIFAGLKHVAIFLVSTIILFEIFI